MHFACFVCLSLVSWSRCFVSFLIAPSAKKVCFLELFVGFYSAKRLGEGLCFLLNFIRFTLRLKWAKNLAQPLFYLNASLRFYFYLHSACNSPNKRMAPLNFCNVWPLLNKLLDLCVFVDHCLCAHLGCPCELHQIYSLAYTPKFLLCVWRETCTQLKSLSWS